MSETIITEENAIQRLENKENLCNLMGVGIRHVNSRIERHKDGYVAPRIPDAVRVLIGSFSRIDGCKKTGENFGCSTQAASESAKGIIGHHRIMPDEQLERMDKVEETAASGAKEKAVNILMQALDAITPDELSSAKLRDKSAVVKDMASAIEKLSEKGGDARALIQFNVYAPKERKEDAYETIDV